MIFDADAFQSVMRGNYEKTPVTPVTPVTGVLVTGAKSLKSQRSQASQVENTVIPNEINQPVILPVTDLCQTVPNVQDTFDPSHFAAALAKLEDNKDIPAAYKEPYAHFQATSWQGLSLSRLDELTADVWGFMNSKRAAWALENGWTGPDLFDRPRGLVWRLQGRKVEAIGPQCYRLEGETSLTDFTEGAANGPQ